MGTSLGDAAKLAYCTTFNGTYTDFAAIEDIVANKIVAPEIKVTKLSDTAETFVFGKILDYGEVTFKLRFDSALVSVVRGWMTSGTQIWIKITVADHTSGSTDILAVYVKSYNTLQTLQQNKEVISEVVFKVTGAASNGGATFTAGT